MTYWWEVPPFHTSFFPFILSLTGIFTGDFITSYWKGTTANLTIHDVKIVNVSSIDTHVDLALLHIGIDGDEAIGDEIGQCPMEPTVVRLVGISLGIKHVGTADVVAVHRLAGSVVGTKGAP